MQSTENKPDARFQKFGKVKTVQSSVLMPENGGLRFILNVANMAGKADSPMYAVFDKKWAKVKSDVKGAFATKTGAYKLGSLLPTTCLQSDVWCLSMLCQDAEQKTDAVALKKCLQEVCKMAVYEHASCAVSSVLMDMVPELPELLKTELAEKGVAITFYQEPDKAGR